MRRYLDRYEVAHLGAPMALVADCVGRLDDSALAAAFGLLCVQYPALRGHVRHDGHGHVLDAGAGHHATFRPVATHDYPAEVARAWDVTRSLATLTVNRVEDRVRVVLCLDHCAGDGRHMYALCESLWRFYTDITTGAKFAVTPPYRLPAPPLEVLASRTGTDFDVPTATPPLDITLPVLRYRRIQLTEPETRKLIETARAHGVSVYAMLVAAAVHAQHATRIWAVIDLRNRVEPPVGPTDTTNFASSAILTLDPDADPLTIARDVRAQVVAAIDAEEPRRHMRDDVVGQDMSRPRASLDAAIVSNFGVGAPFVTPPPLTVTDFRVWAYGWTPPYPMYLASTYRGRLGVDMVFRADAHTDETADLIAAITKATLTRT